MDKALRPRVFAVDPEAGDLRGQWLHWRKFFTTYVGQIENETEANKLNLLINHIDAAVYEYIFEAGTYDEAIQILPDTFAKAPSSIFARYALMSCKQLTGESIVIIAIVVIGILNLLSRESDGALYELA